MVRSVTSQTGSKNYFVFAIAGILAASSALAQPVPETQSTSHPGMKLQLEVIINGRPANLLIAATALPDGELAVQRGELEEAGVKPAGGRRSGPGDHPWRFGPRLPI